MAHSKVYGFCDAKCKVEVVPSKGGTMTGNLIIKSTQPRMDMVQDAYTMGTNPSNSKYWVFGRAYDSSGNKIAMSLQGYVDTSQTRSFEVAMLTNAQAWKYPFRVVASADYSFAEVRCVTPSSPTESSTMVATTEWVNDINNDVVHKSRNETINGNKTHTGTILSETTVGYPVVIQKTNMDVTKTDYQESFITFKDENGVQTGRIGMANHEPKIFGTSINWGNAWYNIGFSFKNDGTIKAVAPTTPSEATGNEIATANWVNTKLARKNKVTNVTSYDQLMDLIKNGKRGDSFGITMDYVGGSMGGINATDKEVHAFGHYTIDEITVSDGALTGLQAFGSGEVSGKLKNDDDTTYVYATTGFGRRAIGTGVFDAFRVVNEGSLTYFITSGVTISAFDGYYISI